MREISLSQGRTAFVDDEDYEALSMYKWCAFRARHNFYAVRRGTNTSLILMHREILNPAKTEQIDHRNHNGLDNQRDNLRICNYAQNQANNLKQCLSTSGFKGVSWIKERSKWLAQIRVAGHTINLGRFNDPVFAARIYDAAAIKYFGKFAQTNFMP